MIALSDESNLSIFFCFYLIIFIVTLNFYRILLGRGKTQELEAFPCIPILVVLHFINIILPIIDLLIVGVLSLLFTSLPTYTLSYAPTIFSLVYHNTMADWMVPLILIYSITLSYDLPQVFHFKYMSLPRDALIWITMVTYGCLFNSLNPWDFVTIRRIHHENGHISTSFNFVDAALLLLSIIFMFLHGYRMSFTNAFRDNRFHITLLFIVIKLAFLITEACLLPSVPEYPQLGSSSSEKPHVYSLDNLKMFESVIHSAIPLHYLAWKHFFFKNV